MYNRLMSDMLALLVIYALATARITSIVTGTDEITRPYIQKLANHINPDELESGWRHLLSYLIACQWCGSIYIGALVAPIAYWHGHHPAALIPAMALTFSQITGMLSKTGRD